MSTNSELRARLERLGPVRDAPPGLSSSDPAIILILRRTGSLDRAIDVAGRLMRARVSLRNAHAVITRLAAQSWAVVGVDPVTDLPALQSDLATMHVEIRRRREASAEGVDFADVRARHALSQRDFAALLGFDVRTLQNWEQGRNRPDPAAASLAIMFDRAPELVEELLSEPVAP